jgi:tyrosine-protein kinase Etk/Wzc
MEQKDNLLGVLGTFLRWRRPLFALVFVVGLGAALISWFFMDNYYQSTTTFYVSSPDLFKPEQIFSNSTKDMDYYGTEADIDRVLSIAQSGELYEFLITKFDLYKHYDIDSTKKKAPFKVRQKLKELYEVTKNKYDAIELSVEDTDPKFAAEMANAARGKVDEIAKRLIRESQASVLKAYESTFAEKEKNLATIGESLSQQRQASGVIDPENQTEAITQVSVEAKANFIRSKARFESLRSNPRISADTLAMFEATMRGYEEELKNAEEVMKRYQTGINGVSATNQLFVYERNQMSRDRQLYQQMRIAFGVDISALKVIEAADVPIEKSRPKRSILVATVVLLTFIFGLFLALMLDHYRLVNWKQLERYDDEDGMPVIAPRETEKSRIGFFKRSEKPQ